MVLRGRVEEVHPAGEGAGVLPAHLPELERPREDRLDAVGANGRSSQVRRALHQDEAELGQREAENFFKTVWSLLLKLRFRR